MTKPDYITVVSGYPRSGTSMMMRILEKGGLVALQDHAAHRKANEKNPNGFYEYGPALQLSQDRPADEWIEKAVGNAVKVLAFKLQYLPTTYQYRVIFMRRKIEEILRSSKKAGIIDDTVDLTKLEQVLSYKTEYVYHEAWLMQQSHMKAIYAMYNDIVAGPEIHLGTVRHFLDLPLDLENMVKVVDNCLYRQRSD